MPQAALNGAKPLGPKALAPLVRQLVAEGRGDEAAFLTARHLGGNEPRRALDHARLAELQHRHDDAARQYRLVIDAEPGQREPWLKLIRMFANATRLADARAVAEEAAGRVPGDALLLLEAARAARRCGDLLATAAWLERALPLAKVPGELLLELAVARIALHDDARGLRLLEELLAANPARKDARIELARAAEEQGEIELARTRWQEVLTSDPASFTAAMGLAKLAEQAGRFSVAEAAYRELCLLFPKRETPPLELGRILIEQARRDEALGAFDRALELKPGNFTALAGRIRALAESDRFSAARREAEALIARFPARPDAHQQLALIEEAAGRGRQALRRLREVEARFPQAFRTSLRLAGLLTRQGSVQAARRVVDAALLIHPGCYPLRLEALDLAFAAQDREAVDHLLPPLARDYPHRRDLMKRVARADYAAGRVAAARRAWQGLGQSARGNGLTGQAAAARPQPDSRVRLGAAGLRQDAQRVPAAALAAGLLPQPGGGPVLLRRQRLGGRDPGLSSRPGRHPPLPDQRRLRRVRRRDALVQPPARRLRLRPLVPDHRRGRGLRLPARRTPGSPHLHPLPRRTRGRGLLRLHARPLPRGPGRPARDRSRRQPVRLLPPLRPRRLHPPRHPGVPLSRGARRRGLARAAPLPQGRAAAAQGAAGALAAGPALHLQRASPLPDAAGGRDRGAAALQVSQRLRRARQDRGGAAQVLGRRPGLHRVHPQGGRWRWGSFMAACSERYRDTGQLTDLGLMRSSPELDAFARDNPAPASLRGWPSGDPA